MIEDISWMNGPAIRPITSKPWRIAWVIGGLAIVVVGAMVFAVHVAGALQ